MPQLNAHAALQLSSHEPAHDPEHDPEQPLHPAGWLGESGSSLSHDARRDGPKMPMAKIGKAFLADFLKNSRREWSSSFLFCFMIVYNAL